MNPSTGSVETPKVRGVQFYKDKKYREAISEFTKFLDSNIDNLDRKVAHYNRGMAYYHLADYHKSVEDAEKCIQLDPFWRKGYKCKGLAIEQLRGPREALEILLDGTKICHALGKDNVLNPEILRLHNKTQNFCEGLEAWMRKFDEKYCVFCEMFEVDSKKNGSVDKFSSCEKCESVNYCCDKHQKSDEAAHNIVCISLLKIRHESHQAMRHHLVYRDREKDGNLFEIVVEYRGEAGKVVYSMFLPLRSIICPAAVLASYKAMETAESGKIAGSFGAQNFCSISHQVLEKLNSWENWLDLPENAMVWKLRDWHSAIEKNMMIQADPSCYCGDTALQARELLSEALTDPMTVIHVLKQLNLIGSLLKKDRVRIHVIGAEPAKELIGGMTFLMFMYSVFGKSIRVVFVGPLITSTPKHYLTPGVEDATLTFGGTYQEYLLSGDYQKPDCIVAFYPGLHDRSYPWLPVVAHAVSQKIPFVITSSDKIEFQKTKDVLLKSGSDGWGMNPDFGMDGLNPFASRTMKQRPPGSNCIEQRNLYVLCLNGGSLGKIGQVLDKAMNDDVYATTVIQLQAALGTRQYSEMSEMMNLRRKNLV